MVATILRRTIRLTWMAAASVAAFGLQVETGAGRGVALGFATAHAQSEALRAEVGKPLKEAAELLKANRAKEALAKVREAEAVPNRTPAETLTIERMRGAAAARAGETQTAIRAFEAVLASGKVGQAEQAQTAASLAHLYAQTKDWNKTREWAQRAKQQGASAADMDKLLAFVNAQSGDYNAIARDAQASIEAAEKAGRRPEENDLLTLADALRRTGNTAGQTAALEKLVAYYPKKEYWSAVLSRIPSKPGYSSRHALDLMRLKRETKTLETAEDYVEMAQMALQESQAVEAKAVLEEGFARGILGKGPEAERQKRLLALATQRAADAPKTLVEAEAEAKDGNALVRIGLAYTALGQHDKGIALIQKGIAKGDLRNPDDAKLELGIAYLRAGNKAKANEAFRSVKGTDGAADLARLWMRV
jgi:lipopolysaccharide biosynthesis regulator YciM